MVPISVFARLTGLSPKALRLYHDRGLLVPSQVDPDTGYRSYALTQVPDAVRISVLRRAGMSLEQVHEVVDAPDRADTLVAEFRAATRRRRDAEDRALAGMAQLLDANTVTVGERRLPAQPFAAVTVTIPSDGDDARVERAGRELQEALAAAGAVPTGPSWTVLDADGDVLSVVWHVPLAATPDEASLPEGARGGILPERVEAFVEIPAPTASGDESVELALATLLATDPARRPDPRTLRQTVHPATGRVEFAVTLGAS